MYSALTSSTATTLVTSASQSITATSLPTVSNTAQISSPSLSSSLSSDAKIALGVVLGLFGTLIIVLGVIFSLHRRKRRNESGQTQTQAAQVQQRDSTFVWERPEDIWAGPVELPTRRSTRHQDMESNAEPEWFASQDVGRWNG